jgi:hypothetical protein
LIADPLPRRFGCNSPFKYAGFFPKFTSDLDWVDAGLLPQGLLVAGTVERAMMGTAERDDKFIACLAAESARLDKTDVNSL